MKTKVRNIFFLIGIVAIVVMLYNFEMPYDEVVQNVRRAGYWFPAIVMLWFIIYLMNTRAWSIIISASVSENRQKPSFWKLYKYTITGFSLNYVTPVGLLGGEPYRIMELAPYVGKETAVSSVILHSMMHIFSHFCFWGVSILLYFLLYGKDMQTGMAILMVALTVFCLLGIYFFMKGYRYGLALRGLRLLLYVPFCRSRIERFITRNEAALLRIDQQIAELHRQCKGVFYESLLLEFGARMVGCLEIMFSLLILTDQVSFWDCVLIQAFTSLFANLFFFMPMQMGAREGGFALAVGGLALSGAYGVYTSLIIRLREVVWIIAGILLMKFGNQKQQNRNTV